MPIKKTVAKKTVVVKGMSLAELLVRIKAGSASKQLIIKVLQENV